MSILVNITGWESAPWIATLRQLAPERHVTTATDGPELADVRYAFVWKPQPGLLGRLPRLEVIVNLGAGVDAILSDTTIPTSIPIIRAMDPNITGRMVEWVTLQVLFHHRQMPAYIAQQRDSVWNDLHQRAASALTVGILGAGVLGQASADILMRLGFNVVGWSRTERQGLPFPCYHGTGCLPAFLGQSDILVCLLPLTPETRGILDFGLLRQLKRNGPLGGPVLINAGRGAEQVEADILRALDDGTLVGATLDVFQTEPLPAASPLWRHPRLVITPHVAADSEPEAMIVYVLDQIARHERGEPMDKVVDRARGY